MKPKYWTIIILAAIATSASAVYYTRQPAPDVGPIVVHHTPKTQSLATTTPEAGMKDWKTYTNSEYGFEFKYPNYFNLRNQSQDVFKIDLILASPNQDLEFILTEGEFTPCEEDCVSNRTQNISGKNWEIYNLQYLNKNGKASLLKKDKFSFSFTSDLNSKNFDPLIFDQILSTFKFTSPQAEKAEIQPNTGQASINVALCTPGEQSFLPWAMGSKTITVKGKQDTNCVIEYTNEVEGGYTVYKCLIPDKLKSINFSEINLNNCSELKSGNVFFDH